MAPTFSEDEIDDLLYFARTGDIEEFSTIKDALCKRENVNLVGLLEGAKDEGSGNGPLHMAAANGHSALIQDICKALSNPPQNPAALAIINSQNKAGNTALHWAALNGHLEAVKVLLDQGADPTITNHRGHDAIYEAELNDKDEVVKWVLKEGGEGLEEGLGGEAAEGDAGEDDNINEDADDGEVSTAQEDNTASDKGEDTTTLLEKVKQIDIKDLASGS